MNNNILYTQDGNTGGYQPPPPPPPPQSYMPPPPPPPPSYSGSQYGGQPQDKASSQAVWALVLGILSWVLCGLFAAIPAWIIGKKEVNAINAGQSSAAGKSMAQVGMWLGIVQTILGILAIIGFIFYMLFVLVISNH